MPFARCGLRLQPFAFCPAATYHTRSLPPDRFRRWLNIPETKQDDRNLSAQLHRLLQYTVQAVRYAFIGPLRSALAFVVLVALFFVMVVVGRTPSPLVSPTLSIITFNSFLRKAGFIPYEDLD